MDKKKIARELVRLAKSLMSRNIQIGESYRVNLDKLEDTLPPYVGLVKKEVKKGRGKVTVKEIRGRYADVYAAGTGNWILGTIQVPLDALY